MGGSVKDSKLGVGSVNINGINAANTNGSGANLQENIANLVD